MKPVLLVKIFLPLLAGLICSICSAAYAIMGNPVAAGIYIVAAALFGIWYELILLYSKDGRAVINLNNNSQIPPEIKVEVASKEHK